MASHAFDERFAERDCDRILRMQELRIALLSRVPEERVSYLVSLGTTELAAVKFLARAGIATQ